MYGIYEPGAQRHGFVVKKSEYIPEKSYELTELEHADSGVRVIHILADDPENFFSIGLSTPHGRSDGVPHILEHMVVQGSKKYPVPGTLFAMRTRTVASYMNAVTGTGFTFYPAASCNRIDFYNLLSVYLDGVFQPLLARQLFQQDGVRLEFETPDDPTTPLVCKGVVVNEMKGSYTRSARRLFLARKEMLYPDTTYGYDSGGVPLELIQLPFEDVVRYHKEHYYPSNAIIFLYGNIPLDEHLAFLAQQQVLRDQKRSPKAIEKQKKLSERAHREICYPHSKESGKVFVDCSWAIDDTMTAEAITALEILDAILVSSDVGLVKRRCIENGSCDGVSSIMDMNMSPVLYEIALQLDSQHSPDEIEQELFTILADIASRAIPEDVLVSAINKLSFQAGEWRPEQLPAGYGLFLHSRVHLVHDVDFASLLKKQEMLKAILEKEKATGTYFSEKIKKYLLNNPHYAHIVMRPDTKLEALEVQKERQILQKIKENMTDVQKQEIIEDTKSLRAWQQAKKELHLLPKIELKDLSKNVQERLCTRTSCENLTVVHHTAKTNSITYQDLVVQVPDLTADDVWLLQLYCDLLPELGVGSQSANEVISFRQRYLGALLPTLRFEHSSKNPSQFILKMHLLVKALDCYQKELMTHVISLMQDGVNFDETDQVEKVIKRLAITLEGSLGLLARDYAHKASMKEVVPSGEYQHRLNGYGYYQNVQNLAEEFGTKGKAIIEKLKVIHQGLFFDRCKHLVVVSDENAFTSYQGHITSLAAFSAQGEMTHTIALKNQSAKIPCYVFPSAVGFTAKVFSGPAYEDPDSAFLQLASAVMTSKFLHPELREKRGAYGAGARYNPADSVWAFFSHRDPTSHLTEAVFSEAVQYIVDGKFDEEVLNEAKIQCVSAMDTPDSFMMQTMDIYEDVMTGKTQAIQDAFRLRLLQATKEDLQKAAQKYLLNLNKQAYFVKFGGQA